MKLSVPDILRLAIGASAVGLLATLVSEAGINSSPRSAGAELAGTAYVIDGDTIEVAGTRIRLWGIDAPEHDQTCQGMRGETYACGRDSTAVMRELTSGQQVECASRDHDRYGRTVAVCRTESGELNTAMVRRGWAVDYTRYSGGRYHSEEQQARRDQLGIWAGRFDMPERWRHRH
jgi:endonuclease YncB( thermonuclease family)